MTTASCCKQNQPLYQVIYKSGQNTRINVCPRCFDEECRSQQVSDRIIRPFFYGNEAVICLECNKTVQSTDGRCKTHHQSAKKEELKPAK